MLHPDFKEHPLTVIMDREQLDEGRYTLGVAAAFLAKESGETKPDNVMELGRLEKSFIVDLIAAVQSLALPSYLPGELKKLKSVSNDLGDELGDELGSEFDGWHIANFVQVKWDALNEWLEKNEPEIFSKFQFPNPHTTPAAKVEAARGITKGAVINAFQGLYFDRDKWSKYLGDPPDWLKECRVSKGSRKASATWNPVLIAAALFDKQIHGWHYPRAAKQWEHDWDADAEIARRFFFSWPG